MSSLSDLYRTIESPDTDADPGTRFWGVPMPGYERHRLAMAAGGEPTLLLAVDAAPPAHVTSPTVLQHLTILYDAMCRISRPDGTIEDGSFTVVRCVSTDAALRAYFFSVAGLLVEYVGASPSRADISQAIDTLIELFRAMTLAPRKSVQGLWAELFVIAQSRNPEALIRAWHRLPTDRYDFGTGSDRVEVKSASGITRQHFFSSDQLYPPLGVRVLVASLFVDAVGIGTSLQDLIEEIQTALDQVPELLLQLHQTVQLTLGSTWQQAQTACFDRVRAERSLLFFEPCTIPRIGADLPPGVSDVRFRADLTGAEPFARANQRVAGGLWRAALKRSR